MNVKTTAGLALLILTLLNVGCGKVASVEEIKAPTSTTQAVQPQSGELVFSFNLVAKPVDTAVDPQLTTCHQQTRTVISNSTLTRPGNSVRLTQDPFNFMFADNKTVGTFSNETKFFYFDKLVPELRSSSDEDLFVQIVLQGNNLRALGSAMAYGGKYSDGNEFVRLCTIPYELRYKLTN